MKMSPAATLRARKYINEFAEIVSANPSLNSKGVKTLMKESLGWDDKELFNVCWSLKRRTPYMKTDRGNDAPSAEGFAWAKTDEPAVVFDGLLPVGAPTDGSVQPVKEPSATDGAPKPAPAPKAPKSAPAPKEAAPAEAPAERSAVAVKPPTPMPEWYADLDARVAVIGNTPCFGGIRDHAECNGCALRVDCTKAQLVAISRLYKGLKEKENVGEVAPLQAAIAKATDPTTARAAATAGERTFTSDKARTCAQTGAAIAVGDTVKWVEGLGVVKV